MGDQTRAARLSGVTFSLLGHLLEHEVVDPCLVPCVVVQRTSSSGE